MSIEERFVVRAHDLNSNGQGVAFISAKSATPSRGLALFVDGLLPGEEAEVELTERRSRWAQARIIRRFNRVPERVEPSCPVFGRCGGCQLQHLDYPAALRWKESQVLEALVRTGGFDREQIKAALRPIIPSPRTHYYRCRSRLPVSPDGIGFYAAGTHNVVPTELCTILDPAITAVRSALEPFLQVSGYDWLRPRDKSRQTGNLSGLSVQVSRATGEVQVSLVCCSAAALEKRPDAGRQIAALYEALAEAVARVGSRRLVGLGLQLESGAGEHGSEFRLLAGQDSITEKILDLRFRVTAGAFFQINPEVTGELHRAVLSAADLGGREEVLDLHSGSGTLSCRLAKGASRVTGIDIVPASIRDAEFNAALNGLAGRCRFLTGDAAAMSARLLETGERFDLLVVDPPRRGLEKSLLATITTLAPPRIVYVSCNPQTLARDLARLGANYRIQSLQPLDMFPQTTHVETVVLMSRA
ncbi:MAG: 23S rRNA (uracil(1939)-C(5))-methyltransferase RlmD [Bacillota bacterium]|nr:23S rRNA (uracil(1939)-C(5))-methyltransferase RlmD [Bacillota bacterium]